MANQSGHAPAKFCPRCGAFYSDLPSKTCPQCFAPLEILSDDSAEVLSAEQEARKRDPEIIARKEVDDERYKEQAFGGCFGLAAIALLTLLISVVIVTSAMTRHSAQDKEARQSTSAIIQQPPPNVYLPSMLGHFKRTAYYPPDAATEEAGYQEFGAAYDNDITIYCVTDRCTQMQIAQFRESNDLWHDQRPATSSRIEVIAHGLDYIIYATDPKRAYSASVQLSK